MRNIQRVGPYVEIVEARSPDNSSNVIRVGVREDSFQHLLHHNFATLVAQFYGMIQDGGLLQAGHAFKGLNRPLMHGEDENADKSVVVYSWRSEVDYVWVGSRFDGEPVQKVPPPDIIFVVLVREDPETFPGVGEVFGSIERWNWIREDPMLPHAPIDWHKRYGEKLWSRNI